MAPSCRACLWSQWERVKGAVGNHLLTKQARSFIWILFQAPGTDFQTRWVTPGGEGRQPVCGPSAIVEVILEVTVKVRGTVSSHSISEEANECSLMPPASCLAPRSAPYYSNRCLSLWCLISQRSRIRTVTTLRDGRPFPKCKLMTHTDVTAVIRLHADLLWLSSGPRAGRR